MIHGVEIDIIIQDMKKEDMKNGPIETGTRAGFFITGMTKKKGVTEMTNFNVPANSVKYFKIKPIKTRITRGFLF